jgi:hypothetical protein
VNIEDFFPEGVQTIPVDNHYHGLPFGSRVLFRSELYPDKVYGYVEYHPTREVPPGFLERARIDFLQTLEELKGEENSEHQE